MADCKYCGKHVNLFDAFFDKGKPVHLECGQKNLKDKGSECTYCGHKVDNIKSHIKQNHPAMESYAVEDTYYRGWDDSNIFDKLEKARKLGIPTDDKTLITKLKDLPQEYRDKLGEATDDYEVDTDEYTKTGEPVQKNPDDERTYFKGEASAEELDHYEPKDYGSSKKWQEDLDDIKKQYQYKENWDFRSFDSKLRSFENLGFTQGDAVKMASLNWSDLSTEVQNAIEVDEQEKQDHRDDNNAQNTQVKDLDEIDYNLIDKSTKVATPSHECEMCNAIYKSSEALMIHYNDIHAIESFNLDGYEASDAKLDDDSLDSLQWLKDEDSDSETYKRAKDPEYEDTLKQGFKWQKGGENLKKKSDEGLGWWECEDCKFMSVKDDEADKHKNTTGHNLAHFGMGTVMPFGKANPITTTEVWEKCLGCDGTGKVSGEECPVCHGGGQVDPDNMVGETKATEVSVKDWWNNQISTLQRTQIFEDWGLYNLGNPDNEDSWMRYNYGDKRIEELPSNFSTWLNTNSYKYGGENLKKKSNEVNLECPECGKTFGENELDFIDHLTDIHKKDGNWAWTSWNMQMRKAGEAYNTTMEEMWRHASQSQRKQLLKTLGYNDDWAQLDSVEEIGQRGGGMLRRDLERVWGELQKRTPEDLNVSFESFSEQDHPRDNDGQFTSKGGGGSSTSKHANTDTKDLIKQIKGGSDDFHNWYRNEKNDELYAEIERRNKEIPVPKMPNIGKIFRDDPDAVSKLEAKVKYLEDVQNYWKQIIKFPVRDYHTRNQLGDAKWYEASLASKNLNDTKKKLEQVKNQGNLERKPVYMDGKKHFKYIETPKESGEAHIWGNWFDNNFKEEYTMDQDGTYRCKHCDAWFDMYGSYGGHDPQFVAKHHLKSVHGIGESANESISDYNKQTLKNWVKQNPDWSSIDDLPNDIFMQLVSQAGGDIDERVKIQKDAINYMKSIGESFEEDNLECPECNSSKIHKNRGKGDSRFGQGDYACNNCGATFNSSNEVSYVKPTMWHCDDCDTDLGNGWNAGKHQEETGHHNIGKKRIGEADGWKDPAGYYHTPDEVAKGAKDNWNKYDERSRAQLSYLRGEDDFDDERIRRIKSNPSDNWMGEDNWKKQDFGWQSGGEARKDEADDGAFDNSLSMPYDSDGDPKYGGLTSRTSRSPADNGLHVNDKFTKGNYKSDGTYNGESTSEKCVYCGAGRSKKDPDQCSGCGDIFVGEVNYLHTDDYTFPPNWDQAKIDYEAKMRLYDDLDHLQSKTLADRRPLPWQKGYEVKEICSYCMGEGCDVCKQTGELDPDHMGDPFSSEAEDDKACIECGATGRSLRDGRCPMCD